jgi:hypothetical protein
MQRIEGRQLTKMSHEGVAFFTQYFRMLIEASMCMISRIQSRVTIRRLANMKHHSFANVLLKCK